MFNVKLDRLKDLEVLLMGAFVGLGSLSLSLHILDKIKKRKEKIYVIIMDREEDEDWRAFVTATDKESAMEKARKKMKQLLKEDIKIIDVRLVD
jgi:hypothetical protein